MRLEQPTMPRASAPRTGPIFKAAWRAGILTAAGVFALSSEAHAANWWWPENDDAVYIPAQPAPKRYQRKQPHLDTRQQKLIEKPTAKPQGPLVIAVSIEQQKMRVYDANGFFAEAPISTGMRGHATPMGVFSVIQKNKWHRSNIYSGAPMPYMQRLTWSGIALHAGVVPGYPASHGCIRMPTSFATKMWGWTRMGARVIITPGDITPTHFTHPLLTARRPAPADAPMASDPQKPGTAPKSDKAATAEPASAPAAGLHPELRAGILGDAPRPPVQTADASAADPGTALVLSDSPARAGAAAEPAPVLSPANADAHADATGDPVATDHTAEQTAAPAKGIAEATEARPDDLDPATTATVVIAPGPPPQATEKASSSNEKAPSVESADKLDGKSDAASQSSAPGKDQSRPGDPVAPAAELPAAKRGGGQIAMFVSAKDQKLYVRQNMTPLFDVPVVIAAGERPLGTHVFTAELAKDDGIRWTVVSLPAPQRVNDAGNSRRSKKTLPTPVKASVETEGPAAALDRVTIPAEAMARIADAITTGTSFIVSDQGITASGETGRGTDFIISLR